MTDNCRFTRESTGDGTTCKVALGDNVKAFLRDSEIKSGSSVRVGDVVVHRCSDIGKFSFSGPVRRRCSETGLEGIKPTCSGLNQHFEYSKSKPPTILFRYEGSISQTTDGKLMVFPDTTLHMECLFMKVRSMINNCLYTLPFKDVRDPAVDGSQHHDQVAPAGLGHGAQ